MIEIGRIKSAIKQITDLPTLPEIYQQVAEMVERPDVSARQLEEVISLDLALSSKLLRMVNSAFYGLSTEVASIERAVAVLGFDTLKQLVLTSSVLQMFKGIDTDSLDPKAVWKHSLAMLALQKADLSFQLMLQVRNKLVQAYRDVMRMQG